MTREEKGIILGIMTDRQTYVDRVVRLNNIPIERADSGCKKCYGRGYTGIYRDKSGKNTLIICRCVPTVMRGDR